MDKNFFFREMAREHQREIRNELMVRNLLRQAGSNPPAAGRMKRLAWLGAPVVITMAVLLVIHFFG